MKNQKSCILTKNGRDKLIFALNEKYKDDYEYDQIGMDTGIDREVISEIINNPNKSSLYKTLFSFFSFLNLDLEEDDYDNPPKKQQPKTVKNVVINVSEPENIIKNALEDLNYKNQIQDFTDFLEQPLKLGIYLIYGKEKHGQRWVLNRLCYEEPYFSNSVKHKISLKRYRHNITYLWDNLAQEFGSKSNQLNDIIDSVYQQWQKNTVILCFDHVSEDKIKGQYINTIISQLWIPLMRKIENDQIASHKYSLSLFLVDYKECCLQDLGCSNSTQELIELEKLSIFKQGHLERWVRKQQDIFADVLKEQFNLDSIVEEVVNCNQTSEKTPEDTLDIICSYFQLEWKDIEKTLQL
ncbi:hypothetical protein WJM97_22490 [Okeanomitos corallinicola TIOX110]|uniref:Inactive STAND domain-containing protein n=1 Tax=Okeanomitos corallinicola TIOX110 TaxID=3133117 RepID=A0ABZ2URR9_9CYAN